MTRLLIFFLFTTCSVFGQTPNLSGKIEIDIKQGKITCDFVISNLPKLDDPAIALNRAFTLYDLKINNASTDYNIDWGFPGRTQFLSDGIGIVPNLDTITNQTKISLKYTGAFPTYLKNEEVASGDNMGIIAFKDKIVRASHQSLWYPILVDRTTNLVSTKYTYDITVICKDCESIYVGGTNPVKSQKVRLNTAFPNDLMLYAGKYKFTQTKNTYYVNSNLNHTEQIAINATIDSIRAFYSSFINTNTNIPIVLAQIFSIGYKNQYEKWAFVVYPCVVADLAEIPKKFDFEKNQFSDIETFRIYSHELAHQYFGLKVKSDNEYWGFFSESFAEFMCLKAIEKTYGKEKYINFIRQKYLNEKLTSKKFIQLDSVKTDIDNSHKYYYYPMVLLGLEQTIGQEKMFIFLNHLVNTTTSTNLNYTSLKQSAINSGVSIMQWTEFENKFVKTNNCLKTINENLEKNGR